MTFAALLLGMLADLQEPQEVANLPADPRDVVLHFLDHLKAPEANDQAHRIVGATLCASRHGMSATDALMMFIDATLECPRSEVREVMQNAICQL